MNERVLHLNQRSIKGIIRAFQALDNDQTFKDFDLCVRYNPDIHFGESDSSGEDIVLFVRSNGQETVIPTHSDVDALLHRKTSDGDVVRMSQSEPPTDRQMRFAETIARTLRVHLPPFCSKSTVSKFISEHAQDYYDAKNADTPDISEDMADDWRDQADCC